MSSAVQRLLLCVTVVGAGFFLVAAVALACVVVALRPPALGLGAVAFRLPQLHGRAATSLSEPPACRSASRPVEAAPVLGPLLALSHHREVSLDGLFLGLAPESSGLYGFFTFAPDDDKFVSAGMLASGGIWDSHLHSALDEAVSMAPLLAGGPPDRPNCPFPIVDAGANLGTLSLYAAAKHGCSVHSYEMQLAVAGLLELSVRLNGLESLITVHHAAVHDVHNSTPARQPLH